MPMPRTRGDRKRRRRRADHEGEAHDDDPDEDRIPFRGSGRSHDRTMSDENDRRALEELTLEKGGSFLLDACRGGCATRGGRAIATRRWSAKSSCERLEGGQRWPGSTRRRSRYRTASPTRSRLRALERRRRPGDVLAWHRASKFYYGGPDARERCRRTFCSTWRIRRGRAADHRRVFARPGLKLRDFEEATHCAGHHLRRRRDRDPKPRGRCRRAIRASAPGEVRKILR